MICKATSCLDVVSRYNKRSGPRPNMEAVRLTVGVAKDKPRPCGTNSSRGSRPSLEPVRLTVGVVGVA